MTRRRETGGARLVSTTKRRSRVAAKKPASLDAERVALEAFGTTEPAARLRALARLAAAMRNGHAASGGAGSASARLLQRAADMAEGLSVKLREMQLFEVVRAMRARRPASSRSASGFGPLLPLRRDTEAVAALFASLELLPRRLRQQAKSSARTRGRPSERETVDFVVSALLQLWAEQRPHDVPTTSTKRGSFGALAIAVLTPSPIGYVESTARAALARAIAKLNRQSPESTTRASEREPSSLPKAANVLIVTMEPAAGIGVSAAKAYAEKGCVVTLVAAEHVQKPFSALPSGITAIVQDPLEGEDLVSALRAAGSKFHVVVIAGYGTKPIVASSRSTDALTLVTQEEWAEHGARRPAGLQYLLSALRRYNLLVRGARVAALVSPHGVRTQNPHEGRHLARLAMRAVAGVVQDASLDVPAADWIVALISEGWGMTNGGPNTHRDPANAAASLIATIDRLRAEHHGQVLEITGGLLPR